MSGAEAALRSRLDLSHRSGEVEWLDQADRDASELAPVLRELARFNGAMLGHRPILAWLAQGIQPVPRNRPLSLLDVGCGYGDLLRAVRRWADRRGLRVALFGLDQNPPTIALARAATDVREKIDFEVANVFGFRPAASVDFIVSSLLAHHLSDEEIVMFLRWMERAARRGWLVCDLERHPVPYHAIALAGKFLRVHPIVIADGQTSVARALTRAEWQERLDAAGIPRAAVTMRRFLFRHVIGRFR